jgi:hypothetical protein
MNTDTYWDQRWQKGETGWDIGYPAPALMDYAMQNIHLDAKILIPGAGSGYEAASLFQKGYHNVHMLDISPTAVKRFHDQWPGFPKQQLICDDFFQHQDTYDFILEQTFYCALDPKMRNAYVRQMHALLNSGGTLAGLLFQFPLTEAGPPFGGSKAEYLSRFEPFFDIEEMETCTNSIAPRQGNELFFVMHKKP